MAATMISPEDVAYEEDVLREPFRLRCWTRYLSAIRAAPLAKRSVIYERALRALPGSYKLWHAYLTELADAARALPVTDRAHAALNSAFERALAAGMSRMPRIWQMYASALLDQRLLTRARRTLDRALRSLPVTQHHRMWPLLLRLASIPGCPAPTATRILRRHLQFDPAHAEDFVNFLVSAGRWRESADHLAAAVNDEYFVSVKGKTKRQLLLDMCDLLAKHPEEVAGMPVDAILRSSIRRFPDEAGALWACLAGQYARVGLDGKARDVFEEGIADATTVKDFRLVFESYVHFEHALVDQELGEHYTVEDKNRPGHGCWLAGRDDGDMALARLERFLERRPEMLNRVQLRQNPHDVQAWHARAKLFDEDPAKQAATYVEAIKTVDPVKVANGKPPPHTLWLAFAKMYEERGRLDSAREVLQRATQARFKAVDHLAAVWCEWAEMELRQHNTDKAIELIRQATRVATAASGEQAAQTKLHRSLKLWCFYADLMETHGWPPESACAVYDRMHELGLITPLLVLRHASLLDEHKRFEDAFRVYERGVSAFKHPHAEPIWSAYLTKLVERHGASRPERVRDVFDDAVRQAPAEKKKDVYMRYAKFEEEFGLGTRVLKVYEEAAAAVPCRDKLAVYEAYIARATALFGVVAAREIYNKAIVVHGGILPDADARMLCLRFADLEVGLGEVDRARALYVYSSGFTDSAAHPDFWKRWNDFEVLHGDECTFREMLRVKRTVAAANAGASAVARLAEQMDGAAEPALKRTLFACATGQIDRAEQCKRRRLV
uniref:Suppressor of forked domain-containing protein n=1 Tax=Leersia perrieri TaxID=77586 RepID=A0A0D9WNP7_9ORYZ